MENKYFVIEPKNKNQVWGVGNSELEAWTDAREWASDLEEFYCQEFSTDQDWDDYDPHSHEVEIENDKIWFGNGNQNLVQYSGEDINDLEVTFSSLSYQEGELIIEDGHFGEYVSIYENDGAGCHFRMADVIRILKEYKG